MSTSSTLLPGFYRGLVEDSADPDGRGRVRLRVPQVLGDSVTGWAWPTLQSGESPRPVDAGDAVWVGFEGGDTDYPVWLAATTGLGAGLDPQVGVQLMASSFTSARNLVFTNPEARYNTLFWSALGPGTTLSRDAGSGCPAGLGAAVRLTWAAADPRTVLGLALQHGSTDDGQMPLPLLAGVQYTLSFYARAASAATFTYRLIALDGTNLVSTVKTEVIGTGWARYALTFFAALTSTPANRLVITPLDLLGAGSLQVSAVQLEVGPNASGYTNNTARTVLDTNGLALYDALGNRSVFLDASTGGATFTGTVLGSDITGGTITIGAGSNILKADLAGLYLGSSTFALAPFRVSPAGALTATSASITGALRATSLDIAAGVAMTGTLRLGSTGVLRAGGTDLTGALVDGARTELDSHGLRYIQRDSGVDSILVDLGDAPSISGSVITSLSASKITTGELAVGADGTPSARIIAGPAGGNHAEMSSDGFSVFAQDVTTGIATRAIQLGTSGHDFFGVTNPAGLNVASIDQDGAASFAKLTVTGPVTYLGRDLGEVIASTGGRVLGWGDPGPGSGGVDARTNAEMGFVEVLVSVPPSSTGGRAMQIMWEGCEIQANSGDSAEVRLRRSLTSLDQATCPAVTVGSELIRAQLMAPIRSTWSGTGASQSWFHIQACSTTQTTYVRMLVSVAAVNGTTGLATFRGRLIGYLVVYDMGEGTASSGGYSTGGGTPVTGSPTPPPPQRQQYTLEVVSNWQRTWRASGSVRSDTTDIVQGYYDTTNGDQRGMVGFPDITGTLLDSTVDHVEVYLYANHWYYNNGGTAIIGVHGYAAAPASFAGFIQPDLLRSAGWPRPGGRWLDISGMGLDAWRSGAYRGVTLGPSGGTNRLYYGRFTAGAAHLKVWYTK